MHTEAFDLAELISGHLLCTLSEEQEQRLFALLEEDKERYKLLDYYRGRIETEQRLEYINSLELDQTWLKVNKRFIKKKSARKARFTFLKYAAVLLLVGGLSIIFLNRKQTNPRIIADTTRQYKNDILPGTQNAKLILSDGKKIDLDHKTKSISDENGVNIMSVAGELKYSQAQFTGSDEAHYNLLIVPSTGTYSILLSDGTKVILNSLSELKFPVRFNSSERNVELKGEAYFEVAKDVERPFKVKLNESEIEVLGTHFNISCYGRTARTTLLEGSVRVDNGKNAKLLVPGKQCLSDRSNISISSANVDKAIAWKQGEFYFEKDELGLVLNEISRWYGVEVIHKKPLPKIPIGGQIKRNVKLSEVIEMLKDITKLSFDIDQQNLIIK